jgi:hypothetical protein
VLKNRETNNELFVVSIELIPTEQAKKQGAEDSEQKFDEVHGKDEADGNDNDLD